MTSHTTDRDVKPWITLRHVAEDGQKADIVPRSFKPLTYSDAIQRHNRYRIEGSGGGTIWKTSIPEKVSGTFSMNIEFYRKVHVYALVKGGWLPVPFVPRGIFLIDQNVLSTLTKIGDGRIQPDYRDIWLNFLDSPRLVINPVFCAWEGTSRRTPTYSEFRDGFDAASSRISAVLPKANVIRFERVHYDAAYTSIRDSVEPQEKETEFLFYAVPLIRERTSAAKLKEYQRSLVSKAKELGLNDRSLVVIAVFSCLFEKPGDRSLPGRKILKPKQRYTEQDAYNALCDLRYLELYMCSRIIEEPMILCTRDRAMTAFWCLIGPHSVRWENGKFTYSLEFSEHLFPRLSAEGREAFLRDLLG